MRLLFVSDVAAEKSADIPTEPLASGYTYLELDRTKTGYAYHSMRKF